MGALFNTKGRNGLTILAEGDSWFAYPRITGVRNIIVHLEKMDYNIENLATVGHNLTDMVYGTIIDKKHNYYGSQQIDVTLDAVAELQPDIVLLSGGGNDICGTELEGFINHQKSGLPPLRKNTMEYMINTVLKTAFQKFFAMVSEVKSDVHFIIHGYGYPPVNGDGVGLDLKGFPMPGPWLKPAFAKNNHMDRQQNEAHMRTLMDTFNTMLATLQGPRVHYVDLRPKVKISDWVNELHLRDKPYRMVAEEFDRAIQML